MADIRGTDIRQEAEQGLKDMASLISRGDYNLALVKGRQTAELLVKGYARENRLIYTDLADTIENLYGENTIGRGSRDAFHAIRQFGNRAVHDNDNDPKDAENSYYLLKNEIEVYLNTNAGTKNRAPVNVSKASEDRTPVYNDEAADIRFTKDAAPKDAEGQDIYRAPVREQSRRRPADAADGDPRSQGKLRTEVSGKQGSGKQQRSDGQRKSGKSSQQQGRGKVPTREDRLKAAKQGKRGGTQRGTRNVVVFDIFGLLRILVPLICIVLLVILLRSCLADRPEQETTTPVQTTESTAPETTAPETTAPTTEAQPQRYVVTGNNVNVRYADNQNRIYEQLSSGTEIGEVETIEGSDYVRFERDGLQLVIHKDYIAPIEN